MDREAYYYEQYQYRRRRLRQLELKALCLKKVISRLLTIPIFLWFASSGIKTVEVLRRWFSGVVFTAKATHKPKNFRSS